MLVSRSAKGDREFYPISTDIVCRRCSTPANARFFRAVAVVAIHLWSHPANLKQEASLIMGVTALGVLVETAFILLGAIHYAGTNGSVPTDLDCVSLVRFWYADARELKLVVGQNLAPSNSWRGLRPAKLPWGVKLVAATIGAPVLFSLAVIGCGWALAMILIFHAADRLPR